tara:strand:- start:4211 stop:5350 length:1140 start_codon:yes stop_codon:yes gene_type:complete
MVHTFKSYLEEQSSVGYIAFGRFNPPTTGHEKLLNKIASMAKGNDYMVFASQSQDSKKNPLDYQTKVKFMRKMFPKHARSIVLEKSVRNFLEAAVHMHNKGYKNLVMVAGSDRVKEFQTLLTKYNGVESRHGLFDFNSVKVVSAGERDPDAEGVTGMSASKMRAAASDNDFPKFLMGLPKGVTDSLAKDLFNSVRKGMNLKENKSFAQHIMLNPVSETREDYVSGDLFSIGNTVIVKETNQQAVISYCGSNYLIIEVDGKRKRVWLDAVEEACWPGYTQKGMKTKNGKQVPNCVPANEKLEVQQDPDIDDKKGSQPATFFRGLKSKSTKSKRDAHFRKMTKKKDDDPSAYKKAPGDATAKTKESPYTKRFRQMYGESYV